MRGCIPKCMHFARNETATANTPALTTPARGGVGDLERGNRAMTAIAAAERTSEAHDPPFHNASEGDVEAREKYIGVASVQRNLRNQRVPDVLIARNQPNRRRDCIIIKDFDSSLVFG